MADLPRAASAAAPSCFRACLSLLVFRPVTNHQLDTSRVHTHRGERERPLFAVYSGGPHKRRSNLAIRGEGKEAGRTRSSACACLLERVHLCVCVCMSCYVHLTRTLSRQHCTMSALVALSVPTKDKTLEVPCCGLSVYAQVLLSVVLHPFCRHDVSHRATPLNGVVVVAACLERIAVLPRTFPLKHTQDHPRPAGGFEYLL